VDEDDEGLLLFCLVSEFLNGTGGLVIGNPASSYILQDEEFEDCPEPWRGRESGRKGPPPPPRPSLVNGE